MKKNFCCETLCPGWMWRANSALSSKNLLPAVKNSPPKPTPSRHGSLPLLCRGWDKDEWP